MSSQQIHVQLNGSDATIILDDRDPRPSRNSSVVPVLPPNYNDNNSTTSAPTIMPPPPTLAPTGAPEMGYTIWGSPFINESMHTLIVSILIALIVVLSIILIVLLMPLFRRSLRRRAATDKKRIKKRQQTVDAWLITKNVRAHDGRCHHVTDVKDDDDDNDEEEMGRECMICMEEFQVGTPVSWSPNEHCTHVYHKECIREWLIRHSDCPYCRRIMLPIDDRTGGRLPITELRVLADQRVKRFAETSYCVEHGLVEHKQSPSRTVSTRSGGTVLEENVTDEEMGGGSCVGEETTTSQKSNVVEENLILDGSPEQLTKLAEGLNDASEKSIEEEMGVEPPLPPLDENNDEESVDQQDAEPLSPDDV